MSDFWKQHLDKFLLSALFLITLGTFMHFARGLEYYVNGPNAAHVESIVNWLENTVGQILAALLTLMVGRSIATGGNGKVAPGNADPSLPATQGAPPPVAGTPAQ